jgi:hypothetical protein
MIFLETSHQQQKLQQQQKQEQQQLPQKLQRGVSASGPPRGHQCLPQRLDFRRNLRMALVELFTKAFPGLEYVLVALRKQLAL